MDELLGEYSAVELLLKELLDALLLRRGEAYRSSVHGDGTRLRTFVTTCGEIIEVQTQRVVLLCHRTAQRELRTQLGAVDTVHNGGILVVGEAVARQKVGGEAAARTLILGVDGIARRDDVLASTLHRELDDELGGVSLALCHDRLL